MQRIVLIITCLALNLSLFAQSGNNSILGKWTNEDKTRVIEFVANGATFDAIIREAEDKSLIGKKQISGLKTTDNTTFIEGTLYLIKRGKSSKCAAKLLGSDQLQLKASYAGLSKTQTWTKL